MQQEPDAETGFRAGEEKKRARGCQPSAAVRIHLMKVPGKERDSLTA